MSEQVYVEIVRFADDGAAESVVRRMGPMGRHEAEKVQRGADINLGHDRFYTRIVPS